MRNFDMFLNEMVERTDLGGKGAELEIGTAMDSLYKWLKSKGSDGIDQNELEKASLTLSDAGLMSNMESGKIPDLVLELATVLDKLAKLTPTQVGGVCGLLQSMFYDPETEAGYVMSVDDEAGEESEEDFEASTEFNKGGFKDMDVPSGLDMERAVPDMEKPEYEKIESETDDETGPDGNFDAFLDKMGWKDEDEDVQCEV